MKLGRKKLLIIFFALAVVIAFSSKYIVSFADYLKDEVLNQGVVVRLSSKEKTVKTGDVHKITIKSSNSSPNSDDIANVKIYLKDENDSVNKEAVVIGLDDNKKVYEGVDPEKNITLELKEDKNENGEIVNRYFEYNLIPGTSMEMELLFSVPTGTTNDGCTLNLVPEVKYLQEKENPNIKYDSNFKVNWSSRFDWSNLAIKTNKNSIRINSDSKFSSNIEYTYNINKYSDVLGIIWTKSIEVTDTITLPQDITIDGEIDYDSSIIYSDSKPIYSITLPQSFGQDCVNISSINYENNILTVNYTLKNNNLNENEITDDFNPVSKLKSILYCENLKIADGYVSSGKDEIVNESKFTFNSCIDNVEAIKLSSIKNVKIDEDLEYVTFTKKADKESIYRAGGLVTYSFEIKNDGRKNVTKKFTDTLPKGFFINTENVDILKQNGFDVSVDNSIYTVSKDIKVNKGEKYNFEIKVGYSGSNSKLVNTAYYGELESSAIVTTFNKECTISKEITKRWENFYENGYNIEYLYTKSKGHPNLFNLLGKGDRIEYTITISNNTDQNYSTGIMEFLPEVSMGSNDPYNKSNSSANLCRFYWAGAKYDSSYYLNKYSLDYNGANYYTDIVNSYNYDPKSNKYPVTIPANTTYKQTVILDIPNGIVDSHAYNYGEQYEEFLNEVRKNFGYSGYLPEYNGSNRFQKPYNYAVEARGGIAAIAEHTVEPKFFMQTGVLARNKVKDFEDGTAIINNAILTNDTSRFVDLNNYEVTNNQIVTYYTYFINDSMENLNMDLTEVGISAPTGFEFLGFNSIKEQNLNLEIIGKGGVVHLEDKFLNTTEDANVLIDGWLMRYDLRARSGSGSYGTNTSYKRYENQYSHDKIAGPEANWCKDVSSSGNIVTTSTEHNGFTKLNFRGILQPNEGFLIAYSYRVNPQNVVYDSEYSNTINTFWDFDKYIYNKYGKVYESKISASTSYDVGIVGNKYIGDAKKKGNDGYSYFMTNSHDSIDNIYQKSIGFGSKNYIWSGVKSTPIIPTGDDSGKNINFFINKVDQDGEKITFNGNSAKYKIYDENKNVLSFKKEGSYYVPANANESGAVQEIESSEPEIYFRKIEAGKYYIEETQAPEGYKVLDGLVELDLTNDDLTYFLKTGKEVKISNTYIGKDQGTTGKLKIEKLDKDTNEIIPTNRFKVSCNKGYFEDLNINNEEGSHYRYVSATKDKNDTSKVNILQAYKGKIVIEELPFDTYTFYEDTTPWGYDRTSSIKVTFKNDSSIEKLIQFKDEKIKDLESIEIIKKDYDGNFINDTTEFSIKTSTKTEEKMKFIRLDNEEDSSVYEMVSPETENAVDRIETYKGKIKITNVLKKKWYYVYEEKAADGYLLDTKYNSIFIDDDRSNKLYISNKSTNRNIVINKKDTKGNIINTDILTYKIFDSQNNEIGFKKLSDGSYTVSKNASENVVTRLVSKAGIVNIKDMPMGEYFVKEIVAPNGYTSVDDKISLKVTAGKYSQKIVLNVTNPEYNFGSENHASISYQKIYENLDKNNMAYGYVDSSDNKKNYILIDKEDGIADYSLKVTNMSNKNFERLTLINKLPYKDDNGVVNLNEKRGSQFDVKLFDKTKFEVKLYDNDNKEVKLSNDDYKIEYSDNTEFTEGDFNGEASNNWYDTIKDTTKSFRITFNDSFILPSKYNIRVEFNAKVSDEANPGEIAWNSFAYRYYVGDSVETAEPPKVGEKIREYVDKTITKIWDDNNNQDGIRPNELTNIELLANDEKTNNNIVLNAENNWSFNVHLLKYDNEDKEITYKVIENQVIDGYLVSYDQDTLTITNKHTPEKITKKVTVIWDDEENKDKIRPKNVTVRLFADGEEVKDKKVSLKEGEYLFEDLDKYKGGKEIIYTVKEDGPIKGYKVEYGDDTFTITNIHRSSDVINNNDNNTNDVTPGVNTPQTGDIAVGAIVVIMIVALGCIVVAIIIKKKNSNSKSKKRSRNINNK